MTELSPDKLSAEAGVCAADTDENAPPHPYEKLDRATRAALARATAGVSPHSIMATWMDWALHLGRSPGRQLELTERAARDAAKLWVYASEMATGAKATPPFQPRKQDHRFNAPGWQKAPFSLWQQAFLSAQDWWQAATDEMPGIAPRDAERAQFQIRQALDLVSPSNFPWSNPEIINRTFQTGGRNLIEGAAHFLEDVAHTITQQHEPAPQGYEIGKDIAATPGRVVYRNALFELIQYTPRTKRVQAEPILFVPAWIMKYYVLDLSPENSMVRYLVEQGFTVFMISWVNPTADQADLSLEDYRLNGVMAAIEAIEKIVPGQKIHANGYCLGGTLLAIAAAVMQRDGDDRLASVTLMAAQVDFAEAGELLLFIDDSQVAFVEDLMWLQGYLDRPQMTRTFTTIRAEDLIYARAVRRYFLGEDDLPTDLTVWNNDTTRMPARMHSEYLRGLFLENRLSAGRFSVEGRVVALKDIRVPMFVVGTESDHIAPWRSVYKIRLFTDGDLTFVLTNGGHNGGILSEPGHKHRHYRLGHRPADALYTSPDEWFESAEEKQGSWWPAMVDWIKDRSSGETAPPPMGGRRRGAENLLKAPGSYIHQT
ncbi:alpha/beta fold hydrolase [Ruegeria sp. HKCCD6228]|uniref:PHA/PHB synthase family protein n=1 Tax=unclassified Ruegeria TaxID=2625375 RepID=UPI001488CFED|nr:MULTISPECIES: alpha/beta fold hydrolase [unclassified Ruegeria]NOD97198.1 alpha/beta fold hydrolase [Ruegeria sp. HKCCD6228]